MNVTAIIFRKKCKERWLQALFGRQPPRIGKLGTATGVDPVAFLSYII